jgi:hypothetical protein
MPTTAELDERIPLAREVIEETMRLYPVGDVIDLLAQAADIFHRFGPRHRFL